MIEISVKENLEKYLLDKNIVDKNIPYSYFYCNGGVSCTVVFLRRGSEEMIIKQALAQLKTAETWLCDQNRMYIEQESNSIYHLLVPDCAPEVYFYDSENYIYGRKAAPENARMWKTDLLSGRFDFNVSRKVISSLATVHEKCANNPEIYEKFKDKSIFYDLRISPYIEFTAKKYPELKDLAGHVSAFLMDSSITLVHGDFSPKNIMIDNDDVYILDYEVAHYGHPAFDLAFFTNHFLLKMVKNKRYSLATANMINEMLDLYFENISYMDKPKLKEDFTKLLALLFLARVDGKSPAEYITDENDKKMIREIALKIISTELFDYKKILKLTLLYTGGDI
ncbi:MAG: phosphotransferase [Lachnospiraceae bacterium]|nr:phosphotransferase [Lachnospiraceae bacterium]